MTFMIPKPVKHSLNQKLGGLQKIVDLYVILFRQAVLSTWHH